jgi:Acyltransferase family
MQGMMPIALRRPLGRPGRSGGGRPSWSELAAVTPPDRDRYLDLLRGLAIAGVVLGHWLVAAVTYRDGRLGGVNALTVLPWAHWLTWAFQVMPLFFLVGGYANAASWASHRQRDGDWPAWVSRRMHRLLRPTTIFVAVLAACSVLAKAAGLDPRLVGDAVMVAGISLWFLVVYLLVTAIAPLMLAAHRRWGLAVPAVLAGALDVARIGLGVPYVGDGNYMLGWVAVHQGGFAWHDGTLTATPRRPSALVLGGLAALVVLTGPGPYRSAWSACPAPSCRTPIRPRWRRWRWPPGMPGWRCSCGHRWPAG